MKTRLIRCDCGNEKIISRAALPNTKSCGCWLKEFPRANATHKQSKSRTYFIWNAMKQRCKNKRLKNYGGRGISYCKRWERFEDFFADMGHAPDGMSIERRNSNKGYEPKNCIWATRKEQSLNRRNNRYLKYNGKRLTAKEWTDETGLPKGTILYRIDVLGWSVEDALTTSVRKFTKHIYHTTV